MTSEHVKKKLWDNDKSYSFVCAGCVNSLGFNVMWEQAEQIRHIIPEHDELENRIMEAFAAVPDMIGALRAVYEMGRSDGGEA